MEKRDEIGRISDIPEKGVKKAFQDFCLYRLKKIQYYWVPIIFDIVNCHFGIVWRHFFCILNVQYHRYFQEKFDHFYNIVKGACYIFPTQGGMIFMCIFTMYNVTTCSIYVKNHTNLCACLVLAKFIIA